MSITPEIVADIAKAKALAPGEAEMRAMPGAKVTESADGTRTVTIGGEKGLAAFASARKAYGDASAAIGAARSEKVPTVSVIHPDGKPRRIPASQEAVLGSRGFRPRVTGRRRLVLTEADARARIAAEKAEAENAAGAGQYPYDREADA